MKKDSFIGLFITVFFIPALAYAGVKGNNKKQGSTASVYTNANAYTKEGHDHPPATIVLSHFYETAANTGTQRIINFHELHSFTINYSLIAVNPFMGMNGFLQQKKYLFYIYPSHNFW